MLEEYIFSGSLPENASTYVTREADKELFEGLKAGKFCYVLNSRQSGKSSLRVRTMQRLRDAEVACVSIDLSSDSVQDATPEQWYVGLIDYLIESFDLDVELKEWWNKHQLHSPLTRFRKFIEEVLLVEVRENIIIFLDEIDSVLSFKFPTDDFFAFIRACHNQRVDNPEYNRLTFCLLGVASPSNLIEDKNRTPFNIGQAIILRGFQLHEVEPLEKGLHPYFENSRALVKEILHWTGGQPFLTQKLCQFMVEESKTANPRTVEQVVKAKIIENWESQDFPEHLRTIRNRILTNEERAGYLLELYQQVRAYEEVTNNDSIEQSELMLSGLVVKEENKLQVLNPIYYQVFNQNWVDIELKKLRPYSEAFRAWVASGCSDESRLLRGKALQGAEVWASDKNISYQDRQFLAASKEKEIQEEIEKKEIAAQIERERKDREATEERNKVLTEANKKARQRISVGSTILVLTFIGAVISGLSGWKANQAYQEIRENTEYLSKLSELSGKLYNNDKLSKPEEASDEARKKIGLAYEIQNYQLKQAFLLASISKAYQQLDKWDEADKAIKKSLDFLKSQENTNILNQKLQIEVLVKRTQGNLLEKKQDTINALKAYNEAFDILKKYSKEINPFHKNQKNQILTATDIESVYRELIKLLEKKPEQKDLKIVVKDYLRNHLYAGLKYSLEAGDWQKADRTTYQLMLYIANRETQGFLDIQDIKNFSCPELKEINNYWVQNSKGRFGFSVQKEIYQSKENRLGVSAAEWNEKDYKNYVEFARAVGWSDDKLKETESSSGFTSSGFMRYEDFIERIKNEPSSYGTGGLPSTIMYYRLVGREGGYVRGSILFSRVATCKL